MSKYYLDYESQHSSDFYYIGHDLGIDSLPADWPRLLPASETAAAWLNRILRSQDKPYKAARQAAENGHISTRRLQRVHSEMIATAERQRNTRWTDSSGEHKQRIKLGTIVKVPEFPGLWQVFDYAPNEKKAIRQRQGWTNPLWDVMSPRRFDWEWDSGLTTRGKGDRVWLRAWDDQARGCPSEYIFAAGVSQLEQIHVGPPQVADIDHEQELMLELYA